MRLLLALAIAVAIYAAALALGGTLYATGALGTGATHNDCVDFRHEIAVQQGIADDDVPQALIKQATQDCLEEHELTARNAFRTEYLAWAAWPALVVAGIFLLWPRWAAALHRQELADEAADARNPQPGA
jgi:hypothetical protein